VHHARRVEILGNLMVVGMVLNRVRMRMVALDVRVQLQLRPRHQHQGECQHDRQATQTAMAARGVPESSDH